MRDAEYINELFRTPHSAFHIPEGYEMAMPLTVLITGITGFAGSHLAEHLVVQPGIAVHGTVRWRSSLAHLAAIRDQITLHECDLRDPFAVRQLLATLRPARIYHLASQSFVHSSWGAPAETLTTNVLGQLNLLEACRAERLTPRLLITGSSEEYGQVELSQLPITETTPLRPLSPYAVSKVTQDLLGFQYAQSYGLWIIRTRAFNHTGPRRGQVFATSNFAWQLAQIEAGRQPPVVQVGNLEARRDFTDVRDVVRGYVLALERGVPGDVYNLCSGVDWTLRAVLTQLCALIRVPVAVTVDPARLRPSDVPVLRGDATKLQRQTGWTPTIPFTQTLADLLAYWRAHVAAGADTPQPGVAADATVPA